MIVLILGGTGAMGSVLTDALLDRQDKVYVTTRKKINSNNPNLSYIQGSAKQKQFLFHVISTVKPDVIVDYMSYDTSEFLDRIDKILEATSHYIFFSSCRMFSESKIPITEESPRLIDTVNDKKYLESDEYAIAKAKQEDMLKHSKYNNWTIIRPYITYGSDRLQFGTYEKEQWLYRLLQGKTVVMSKQIAEKYTTMTFNKDVSYCVLTMLGKDYFKGRAINIAQNKSLKWKDVWDIYSKAIYSKTGMVTKIKYVDDYEGLGKSSGRLYQMFYDRLYNRQFDDTLVKSLCNIEWTSTEKGLEESIRCFLDRPQWKLEDIRWKYEGYCDYVCGEKTDIKIIPGIKNKIKYVLYRYFFHL